MDLLIKAFDVAKRIYDAVQTERSNSEEAIALRNDVKIIMGTCVHREYKVMTTTRHRWQYDGRFFPAVCKL